MASNRGPVLEKDRIVAIDVLRGFALLSILAANIALFDLDLDHYKYEFDLFMPIEPIILNPTASIYSSIIFLFVANKMMAVFSMLFGAGLLLTSERIESQGQSSLAVHYRRNSLLIAIGLVHSALWFGDVLILYGGSALFLFPVRHQSGKNLVASGVIMWLLIAIFIPANSSADFILRAPSMMLIGMGLYRLRIITAQRDYLWYRKMLHRSFTLGTPICLTGLFLAEWNLATSYFINNLGVPFIALGYVCLIMWICVGKKLLRVQAYLAAVGQIALTNYLTQTILGMLLVTMLNEARGERVTAFWMIIVTIMIWVVQLIWSKLWTHNFHYGPTEWVWRSATYRRKQPLRR